MTSGARLPTEQGADRSVDDLAAEIVEIAGQIGLPYVAASADVGDPAPLIGLDGRPYAETLFKWFDPDLDYWNDRTFALRSGFIQAARICAEPFYFDGLSLQSWRAIAALDLFNQNADYDSFGVKSAIICPCHMPFGVLGAVVMASDQTIPDFAGVFRANADRLFLMSIRFLSAYRDSHRMTGQVEAADLTRREIQCLRWAALGKTDNEIGTIMGVSVPTVRFHLVNASKKFGVHGRAQAVRVATSLGYIGGRGG